MLQELTVKNLAIIEDLSIRFGKGLNVLTGQTGAGKSILVGAIGLVMGNRASSEMIRDGCETAEVQALFDLSGLAPIIEKLRENDIEETGELIVRRVITTAGKNRIYLNGSLSTLSFLKELGEWLVNIYGQHESQGLLRQETHLDILDEFGGLAAPRQEVGEAFDSAREKLSALHGLQKREADRAQREDYLRYVISEIEGADIRPGELDELKADRLKLSGAEKLAEAAQSVIAQCYDSQGSVIEIVQSLELQTGKVSGFDPEFERLVKQLQEIGILVDEAVNFCRDYTRNLEHDPNALERLDDRIHEIKGLCKKYGPSEGDLLSRLTQFKNELSEVENLGALVEQAQGEYRKALSLLADRADALEKLRKKAAAKMALEIVAELSDLDMKGARFEVDLAPIDAGGIETGGRKIDRTGANRAEFLLSANPGQSLRPLAKIASGGELSRILLAIKNSLAKNFFVPCLVFDEVDAGIGGKQAEIVGKKLKAVSKHHQVLCITHLPQIASKADRHFNVIKKVTKGQTKTEILNLEGNARVEETARMLSGEKITETTLAAASEMILNASR